MKRIQFLAVMALIMTFGCSKDTLIETEQDSVLSEQNTILEKNVVSNKGFGSYISFEFISIANNEFEANCLPIGRKILESGFFEENIQGYGVIKPSLSYYNFSNYCVEVEIDSTMPNFGEKWKYELKIIGGVVATSNKDCFLIDIEGDLYPWYDNNLNIDTGTFVGIAKAYSGKGKFRNFNRRFDVGKYGPDGLDLGTGELHFWVH
jgi:hypothetical protein